MSDDKISEGDVVPVRQEPIFYQSISVVRLGVVAFRGAEYSEYWHDLACTLTEITTLFPDEPPYQIEYSYMGYVATP